MAGSANVRSIVANDGGRAFIQPNTGLLSCCPVYLGCIGLSGIAQARSENTIIKCPSTIRADEYDTIDKVAGILDELTFDLTSYLGKNGISVLRQLFQDNCESVLHVHFGTYSNPQLFTEFDKAFVLNRVLFNNYTTGDLITLDSANRNVIPETVSANADSVYEYFANPQFSLAMEIDAVDNLTLHLLEGGACSTVCAFGSECLLEQCAEDFWLIPEDVGTVDSFSTGTFLYTINEDGTIKRWEYNLIAGGGLVIGAITLGIGETITSAGYYDDVLVTGTSDGRIVLYNVKTNNQVAVLDLANAISVVEANEFGYLIADNTGNIYYSETGDVWAGPTVTGAGSVTALLLYGPISWLVANTNTNMFYTNDAGDTYTRKSYATIAGQPITQFGQSNISILHAINDTVYYQSFDAGCNWSAINLSKYFSEIFSFDICPTNPYIIYLAGLSVDTLKTYIVEINFGM